MQFFINVLGRSISNKKKHTFVLMKKPLKNNITILADPLALRRLKITLGLMIAVFAFCLYAQSISFNYAFDDFGVIKDNRLVASGLSAIPQLLKTDRLYSGNEDAFRMPEYRPIPMIVFALEWQFFPDNPHIYHLINVLMYALSCWLLFLLLCKLFENQNFIFPFICALLYAAHPIHTEVVDNIKSLDEILCFLFSVISLLFLLESLKNKPGLNMVLALIFFFISLLSKENAIAFLLITPLVIFVFTNAGPKRLLIIFVSLLLLTVVFFVIRHNIIDAIPKDRIRNLNSPDINSIIAARDLISQKATAIYILLRYLLLLIFPYHLAYDYSIAEIPIQTIGSPLFIIALLLYMAIGIYAFIKIRKKDTKAFSILLYLITLAPVANVFILINWTMAERFLFIPSLGFCMFLALLLLKIFKTEIQKSKYKSVLQMIKMNARLSLVLVIILGLYSFRTITRNPDWKDNTTLFTHDVNVVPNNAFAHYSYGSELLFTLYPEEKNAEKKEHLLHIAISEFNKAISIYNDFSDAYAYLGVAYANIGDFNTAISNYEMSLRLCHRIPPSDVFCDLGLLYCNTGQFDKAISILDSSLKYYPRYTDAYVKKSHAYLIEGKNAQAILECEKLIHLDVNNVFAYVNLGCAYLNLRQYEKASANLNKALQLDPSNTDALNTLGIMYQKMGDTLQAKQYFEKVNIINNQK
jgi:protein O-mannosyl-transferase